MTIKTITKEIREFEKIHGKVKYSKKIVDQYGMNEELNKIETVKIKKVYKFNINDYVKRMNNLKI